MLLTEEMVRKFFGDENPIGQVITVENRHFGGDYTITGILRDIPENTTPSWKTGLDFDFLTSTAVVSRGNVRGPWEGWNRGSSWFPLKTYVVLPEGYAPEALEREFSGFVARHLGQDAAQSSTYRLQSLKRIHLYSEVDFGRPGMGGITSVYLLGAIAFFTLLIAGVNFTNLATARYATRAKEVSMRKVAGAHWRQLIQQFLGESILLAFLALLLAIGFVELVLPAFSDIVGKNLALLADPRPSVLLHSAAAGDRNHVGHVAVLARWHLLPVLPGQIRICVGQHLAGHLFRRGAVEREGSDPRQGTGRDVDGNRIHVEIPRFRQGRALLRDAADPYN